jgi:hypothetical protein
MTTSQTERRPTQEISDDPVASNDYKTWSPYGAPWWQTLPTGRKSEEVENGRNKRKPLPWVATGCDGKEGVDGSSPSEGFAVQPATSAFLLSVLTPF